MKWIGIVAACVAMGCAQPVAAQIIHAETFFGNVTGTVNIETAPGQTLLFDASRGELVLNGNKLEIYADEVEVVGDVVIRSYPATAKAKPAEGVGDAGGNGAGGGACGRGGCPGGNGATGGTGPTGGVGRPAKDIVLDIKRIKGTGKLHFITAGEKGGDGGPGGRGGDAGPGGAGAQRACPDMLGRGADGPGDGGRGGTGGTGGTGGSGGPGGAAGNVNHSDSVLPLIQSGKISFDLNGGSGGGPGAGGGGGNLGTGGPMGGGAACGGGGTNGPHGSPGGQGPSGSKGPDGAPGRTMCFGRQCP